MTLNNISIFIRDSSVNRRYCVLFYIFGVAFHSLLIMLNKLIDLFSYVYDLFEVLKPKCECVIEM